LPCSSLPCSSLPIACVPLQLVFTAACPLHACLQLSYSSLPIACVPLQLVYHRALACARYLALHACCPLSSTFALCVLPLSTTFALSSVHNPTCWSAACLLRAMARSMASSLVITNPPCQQAAELRDGRWQCL
jgi:hypothetical protein